MQNKTHNPWRTHSSKTIYSNPWIKLREDQVTCPDGSPGIYSVVEGAVATGALAVDDEGQVVLVGQYRYPTDCYSWEIVAGGAKPGETPMEASQRELQEEVGLVAARWEMLGAPVHTSNCISNETAYLYLARDLHDVPSSPDHTEVLQIKKMPFKAALEAVHRGEITDAMSIIAIMRAERLL